MKKFGGSWTLRKLDAFINYVKAYARILNSVRRKYHWKTIYFDGFAGFGERTIEKETGYFTLDCFPEENDYNIYQGSVARILNLPVELKTVCKFVTPKPLELKNSKDCTIFHFIFASNNSTALKIASEIIKSR